MRSVRCEQHVKVGVQGSGFAWLVVRMVYGRREQSPHAASSSEYSSFLRPNTRPAPHNRYRDGAPLPGFFWLLAIGELVSNKPCAILAASWSVSGDGQCRDETR